MKKKGKVSETNIGHWWYENETTAPQEYEHSESEYPHSQYNDHTNLDGLLDLLLANIHNDRAVQIAKMRYG